MTHSSEAAQVISEARARGIQRPYVFCVQSRNESEIAIGL